MTYKELLDALTPYRNPDTNLIDVRQFAVDNNLDMAAELYGPSSGRQEGDTLRAGVEHNTLVRLDRPHVNAGWLWMVTHVIALVLALVFGQ